MTNERLNRPSLLSVYNSTVHIPTTAKLRVEFLKKMADNGISITYYIRYAT